ncbi:methyltransferase [Mycena metata]|uniref:tRNA N(3)-methylcytidine methyltransferase n=1 Tax=Mycena metata TaxID=1033252 RepID=A0AAD7NW28_9AGAR|nr:methyltransferase [Mycena metata]
MDPQPSTSTYKPKQTSSVHDISSEKPPFGSRFLTNEAEVWTQNAWDHVPPPDDQDEIIAASLQKQRSAPVPEDDKPKYNERPARHWDTFYRNNSSNFFRDRKWLHNEFRELISAAEPDAGPVTILEVGCGTGAAIFPLLSANHNPHLTLRAFDYSKHAIRLVQENALYKAPPIGTIEADVWDLTSESLPAGVEPGSADIVIMVFVFSALHPEEWSRAVANVHKILKPNGLLLFRDYGRHDMAQLRFKGGRLLDDNFYIRGDKTRVYFFEMDELALLFTGARTQSQSTVETHETVEEESEDADGSRSITPSPLPTPVPETEETALPNLEETTPELPAAPTRGQIHPSLLASPPPALFTAVQLGVDRRLLLNRKRQVKMYRVWMQAKFRKVESSTEAVNEESQ